MSLEAVINELTAVVGSIIYFQEYESPNFTAVKKFFFTVGLLTGIVGVLLLAYWRKQMEEDKGEGAEPDLYQINPEVWLNDEDFVDIQSEVSANEQSQLVTPSIAITPESVAELQRHIVEEVILNPSPFTPSPMLSWSVWGVPKTPRMRAKKRNSGYSSSYGGSNL